MSSNFIFIIFTVLWTVRGQQMAFKECPEHPSSWPIQHWNRWHIMAGQQVAFDLGWGNAVSINCISGNVFDEYSGQPNFQLVISAPKIRYAEFDLTPYVNNNKNLSQGIWLDTSFGVQYPGTKASLNTNFNLLFRNQNSLWNADFNFTFTYGMINNSQDFNGPIPPYLSADNNNEANAEDVKASSGMNATNMSCVAGCTPQGSMNVSDCSWYHSQQWLPLSYRAAASCACTLQDVPGRLSPTANCVRAFLRDAHQGTKYFSETEKEHYASLFRLECVFEPFPGGCIIGSYYDTVSALMVPTVYRIHVDAYQYCCCPHPPATMGWWYGVMFGRLHSLVWSKAGCAIEMDLIEKKGPCGCENW